MSVEVEETLCNASIIRSMLCQLDSQIFIKMSVCKNDVMNVLMSISTVNASTEYMCVCLTPNCVQLITSLQHYSN